MSTSAIGRFGICGSAARLMVVPQAVRQLGVSAGPWLGGRDRHDLEKGIRRPCIATECRPNFHKRDRTNAQAVGEMTLQAGERRRTPGGAVHNQIQHHRGVHHPSHLFALTLPQVSQSFFRRRPGRRWQLPSGGFDPISQFSETWHLSRSTRLVRQRHPHPPPFAKTTQQPSNNDRAVGADADGGVDGAHPEKLTRQLTF